jgi:hypothetical protein
MDGTAIKPAYFDAAVRFSQIFALGVEGQLQGL